jgi:hypothetical protein
MRWWQRGGPADSYDTIRPRDDYDEDGAAGLIPDDISTAGRRY